MRRRHDWLSRCFSWKRLFFHSRKKFHRFPKTAQKNRFLFFSLVFQKNCGIYFSVAHTSAIVTDRPYQAETNCMKNKLIFPSYFLKYRSHYHFRFFKHSGKLCRSMKYYFEVCPRLQKQICVPKQTYLFDFV